MVAPGENPEFERPPNKIPPPRNARGGGQRWGKRLRVRNSIRLHAAIRLYVLPVVCFHYLF